MEPPFDVYEDLHPRRERVDAGDADAVKAAGDLIVLLIELAPSVQLRHDELEGRDALFRVDAYGDAPAVILDANDVVLLQDDEDIRASALEGLVDGIVDDLVDEMVKAVDAGRPDVHAGPLTDCLETFQYLDAVRGIG
jgi:hypothetical protein